MLGCPYCYHAFKAELVHQMRKMHGKVEHLGKIPLASNIEYELLFEYKRLLAEKEELILNGKFKESVKVGLVIRELEEELEKRGLK